MLHDSWNQRITRAEDLADAEGATAPLLSFYARLLRNQSEMYRLFGEHEPRGIERDVDLVRTAASPLLLTVATDGPRPLAAEAQALLNAGPEVIGDLLVEHWRDRSDRDFFGKAILQPYAQRLVEDGPETGESDARRCPRCGGAPQLSIVDTNGGSSAEGASRRLLCATCLTAWPFPRVICANCGGEDGRKLGYFRAASPDHVRIDKCDTCRYYIKSIDVGRLGLAVPLVDEVAASALDLWARDRGYEKIELNLLGV